MAFTRDDMAFIDLFIANHSINVGLAEEMMAKDSTGNCPDDC
jgi:propanediol dehydratase large subunit